MSYKHGAIKFLGRYILRGFTILSGIVIIWLLFIQRTPKLPIAVTHADKWLHAMLFGGLTLLVAIAWQRQSKTKLWLGMALFSLATEISQGAFTTRTASSLDYLANLFGITAAIILLLFIALTFRVLTGRTSQTE